MIQELDSNNYITSNTLPPDHNLPMLLDIKEPFYDRCTETAGDKYHWSFVKRKALTWRQPYLRKLVL